MWIPSARIVWIGGIDKIEQDGIGTDMSTILKAVVLKSAARKREGVLHSSWTSPDPSRPSKPTFALFMEQETWKLWVAVASCSFQSTGRSWQELVLAPPPGRRSLLPLLRLPHAVKCCRHPPLYPPSSTSHFHCNCQDPEGSTQVFILDSPLPFQLPSSFQPHTLTRHHSSAALLLQLLPCLISHHHSLPPLTPTATLGPAQEEQNHPNLVFPSIARILSSLLAPSRASSFGSFASISTSFSFLVSWILSVFWLPVPRLPCWIGLSWIGLD